MAYDFNFDLTNIPKSFFEDMARISKKNKLHKKAGTAARSLANKFKIYEITGLPVSDGLTIVEDLLNVYINNLANKKKFTGTKKRVLFLPHCSRKHMDSKCKASFDPEMSSYKCARCSPDCLVNKATVIAKKKGYDVYIVPGGSCIRKIMMKKQYEGVIGVACCEEVKIGLDMCEKIKIPVQGIPLIKNGCSHTRFDMKMLKDTL